MSCEIWLSFLRSSRIAYPAGYRSPFSDFINKPYQQDDLSSYLSLKVKILEADLQLNSFKKLPLLLLGRKERFLFSHSPCYPPRSVQYLKIIASFG